MRDKSVKNMRKKLNIIYIAVIILCLFQLIIGCGDKNEPPTKAASVSKKIVSKKSASTKSSTQLPVVVAKKEIADVKETKSDNNTAKVDEKTLKQNPDKKIKVSSGDIRDELLPKVADVSKIIDKQSNNDKIEKQGQVLSNVYTEEIAKLQPEGITNYNPEGKIDPFAPLFKQGVDLRKSKKMRTLRTPLEMVDLSQLKLVATMRASSGNRALVEETSGKGYVVAKGTYIGNNSGKIVKILNDRIIVEEEIENIIGEKKIQERELKLQKPLGEE